LPCTAVGPARHKHRPAFHDAARTGRRSRAAPGHASKSRATRMIPDIDIAPPPETQTQRGVGRAKSLKSLDLQTFMLNRVAHRFGENGLSRGRFRDFCAQPSTKVLPENRANAWLQRPEQSNRELFGILKVVEGRALETNLLRTLAWIIVIRAATLIRQNELCLMIGTGEPSCVVGAKGGKLSSWTFAPIACWSRHAECDNLGGKSIRSKTGRHLPPLLW
jgi:hypothetical protein